MSFQPLPLNATKDAVLVDINNEPITIDDGGGSLTIDTDSGPIDANVINQQKSAFGALVVAEPTPIVQLNFNYNINEELVDDRSNNGTASIESNMLKISTGAAANQSALINSKIPVKYNSGQGAHVRFSGMYTTGVSGSNQLLGGGDSADGLFFGYQGDTFGIMRRYGGAPEVRIFEVTTKSTTAEDITVTLDGDSDATVTVSDATATDATTTANDIAAHDYSGLGRGWDAHAKGVNVVFISYDSQPRTGAYSITATTAVVSVTNPIAGVTPSEEFIAQTSWNLDNGDNTGDLPTMDWTKGNVFQVQYQWLGFGVINFLVENPEDGEDITVHRIQYPNANTTPSLGNPNLQLCAFVENTSNTSDIIARVGSMGGFVEGKVNGSHFHNGIDNTVTIATDTPILSIHNRRIYSGAINKIRIKVIFTSAGTDGNKSAVVGYRLNSTLTGASFTEVEPDSSVVEFDLVASAVTGGDEQFKLAFAKIDSYPVDMSTMSYFLNPGDTLTLVGNSAATNDITASVTWEELF